MFNKLNTYINNNKLRKFFIYIPFIVLGIYIISYIYNANQLRAKHEPTQVLLALNEPVWPKNPLINTLTYNSLNDLESTRYIIKTKAQEESINQECILNYRELQNRRAKTPLEERELYLRNITCLHYKGALMLEDYWSLQGISALNLAKKQLVAQFQSNGETVRAKAIDNINLQQVTLSKLRNGSFFSNLDSDERGNINLFCLTYMKNIKDFNIFSPQYEFDSAVQLAAVESCLLINFFFQEDTRR